MAYIGNSPANVGNYQIVDDISSSFNGSLTSFALTSGSIAITPAKSGQLLVGVNGVLQEPDDTGTNGFKVSGSNVVFSSAPESGDTFWAVYQGQNVDIGTPSNDVVDTVHIKDNAITSAKIAAGAIVASDVADDSVTTAKIADDAVTADKLANSINTEIAANTAKTGITTSQANAITANTAKVTNATHSGEVTGATALTIADNVVDEANLKVSNTPTNGYFLSAQSGNTGGMTWAEVDALPSQSGNSGKYLTTDGSAALWAVLDTDANTTTKGLYEHAHTIAANYSITSGNNAMTAGPITINSSVSVTIPSGSTWVIAQEIHMAKVKIQGHASGTGVLTVTAPNTSTDRTITLPDTTGTLLDENSSLPAANLTGTVADARISTLTASKLTGNLPAISGAALTNLPGGGKILQVVANHVTTTDNYNGTSFEATFLTGSITPSATSSKIWFLANCPVMKNGYDGNVQFKWYRKIGSGSFTEYAVAGYTGDTNSTNWETSWLSSNLLDSPNTTSQTTYTVYGTTNSGNAVFNGPGDTTGVITLMEIEG